MKKLNNSIVLKLAVIVTIIGVLVGGVVGLLTLPKTFIKVGSSPSEVFEIK